MSAERNRQARRLATEERILDAFEAVLERGGIRALSINAVVAEAGVGKTLVYRYFDGLSGLIRAWGERRAMFVDPDPPEGTGEDRFDDFKDLIESDLLKTAAHLRSHPVTLEFLAEELAGHNEFSDAFNEVRRRTRQASVRRMMRDSRYVEPENRRLILLIYAAITHLAIRAQHSPSYFGMDLASEEGWAQIIEGVQGLFDDARLAARMRRSGSADSNTKEDGAPARAYPAGQVPAPGGKK
jgi:AcrR family transcriptional regulator